MIAGKSHLPTYFYCVVPAGRAAPDSHLSGVAGSPVRVLPLGGGADAWVSTVEVVPHTAERSQRRDLALAHDRVVAAALGAGITPVPARAGTAFADDADCAAGLAERLDSYARALARLDGLVEMTVSVELEPAAPPAGSDSLGSAEEGAGPGLRHLLELRKRAGESEHVRTIALNVAAELSAIVRQLARETAVRAHAQPRLGVAVSHLVARTDAAEYRGLLAGHRIGAHAAAVVTGPSAPYSFASSPADSPA